MGFLFTFCRLRGGILDLLTLLDGEERLKKEFPELLDGEDEAEGFSLSLCYL